MTLRHAFVGFCVVLGSVTFASAQQDTQNVEVEPVTCWWRTTANTVRVGQPFSVILTCSALETEAAKAVIDRGRLAAAAVQLPPYEITGGTQSDDVVTASRRFMQYEYTTRLIGDDVFGAEVPVPPLQISYRIESKVQQDSSVQGREQTYILPVIPIRIASLVPTSETHIREAPVTTLTNIAARQTRGSLMRTSGTIVFVVAGLVFALALLRAFQQRRGATAKVRTHLLSDSSVLAGVRRELRGVQQQAAREGWNEGLAARALTALRVTASYASGQPVAQRWVNGSEELDGQLVLRRPFGGRVLVSGAATAAALPENDGAAAQQLRLALAQLTTARYGRVAKDKNGDIDGAIESGLSATSLVASKHTWLAQTLASLKRSVTWRPRAWAR